MDDPLASSSKDPDTPINFAFLKGPKRKRLAKVSLFSPPSHLDHADSPCSNCYFASKDCSYTDASGRPVPAPRSNKSGSTSSNTHHPPVPDPSAPASDKRRKYDTTPEPQPIRMSYETSRLDPCVVRELVNLFFAHCQPYTFIIHKPSFSAALSHDRIPCYLLHTICAIAAPLSKNPAVRTHPQRIAGNPYAQEAVEMMFSKEGRLVVEPNLVTVQALCILQSHELSAQWPWTASTQLFTLALKILEETLHVHARHQNHPVLTPVPSSSFVFSAIDRECARRAFWLIRLMHLTGFTYYYVPIPPAPLNLSLRLPVDETSFELAVHSTLSEYLHVPAPHTQYASEFGHLIRIVSIHWALESTLRAANVDSMDRGAIDSVVQETERALTTWEASLAEHIRFSEASLELQLSMFETGSNGGAWAYFLTHIAHATCVLAVLEVVGARTDLVNLEVDRVDAMCEAGVPRHVCVVGELISFLFEASSILRSVLIDFLARSFLGCARE
ncbi:hypothetical protein EW146_g9448 [Bondarzewia mesenterica]|uniref:Xylanolytic transcriptional activator regulatory domain-containing protein n=1 Tax=Bondarzewia mesenterica TaxID=1095465 RepID=A0A4S4L7R3_9AGAM|nr:hypothetical protein EW146_g9448 [Bondarzewia mesenterica]